MRVTTHAARSALHLGLLTAGWILAGGTADARAQFSVRPVRLGFDDTVSQRVISIRNEGTAPFDVRLYTGDFDQTEDGRHRFLDIGHHPRSCGERLSVVPAELTIRPGRAASARIRLESGHATCWSAVFVEKVSTLSGGIRVGQRIAVKVHGNGPDARLDGAIETVAVVERDGARMVRVDFRNGGDVPVRPEGTLEVRDLAGEVVQSVPLDRFSVLPGHARRIYTPLPDRLEAGTFLAVPVFDIGLPHLLGGQTAFEVSGG